MRCQGKLLPAKLEIQTSRYRESQLWEQKPAQEPVLGLEKPKLELTNCWSLGVDKSEREKPQRDPILPLGDVPGLAMNIVEKSPQASGKERGK